MVKPIKLVTRNEKSSKNVNLVMRNARDMIKSEGIIGIAIAAVSRDGYTFSLFEAGDNTATLIGAVERLKKNVIEH